MRKLEESSTTKDAWISDLQMELDETKGTLDWANHFRDTSFKLFVDSKNMLLNNLKFTRIGAVRDFMQSDSFKYYMADRSDALRLESFTSAISQLQKKDLVPREYNWKNEVLSPAIDAKGVPFPKVFVPDEVLGAHEFVECVTDEGGVEVTHGGPYLPGFVPNALGKVCMVPFEENLAFMKSWYYIPARVLGKEPDYDMFESARASFAEALATRASRTATSAPGLTMSMPTLSKVPLPL